MNIYFTSHGDGPPLILLHGLAASSHDWDRLIPVLVQAGFRVYAPDLPGHGNSAKPLDRRMYQANNIYAHLEDWILNLRLPAPPVLVGHSLGGFLSLYFALRHPDRVKGLVLLNPFYTPGQIPLRLRLLSNHPEWGERALRTTPLWLIELVTALEPYDAHHCAKEARLQEARDYKRACPGIAYIPASLPDLAPSLGKLRLPVSVIWGDKDLTLDPHSFPKLVKSIPNASGYIIRGRGHKPHLSQPVETHALILEFLIFSGLSRQKESETRALTMSPPQGRMRDPERGDDEYQTDPA